MIVSLHVVCDSALTCFKWLSLHAFFRLGSATSFPTFEFFRTFCISLVLYIFCFVVCQASCTEAVQNILDRVKEIQTNCSLIAAGNNALDIISAKGIKQLIRISQESSKEDMRMLANKALNSNPLFLAEVQRLWQNHCGCIYVLVAFLLITKNCKIFKYYCINSAPQPPQIIHDWAIINEICVLKRTMLYKSKAINIDLSLSLGFHCS